MAPSFTNLLIFGQIILSGLRIMSPPPTPSLSLSLTPHFDSDHSATSIGAAMSLSAPGLAADDVLVVLPQILGNVPSQQYDGDAIQASDATGHLQLYIRDKTGENQRRWHVSRATHGDVTLKFLAVPRKITNATQPGPRVDLRTDQGGLIGCGISMLPVPPESSAIYDIHVKWNLDHAPPGATAAWTFGEGETASRRGPVTDLSNTVFAVGPLHSYSSPTNPDFGFYWFGEPTLFDAAKLAQTVEKMFARMAAFFNDHGASYRVFVRRSTARGFGGGAYAWSFVLEYDNVTKLEDDDALSNLLAHEMVHNWPIMKAKDVAGGSEDGDSAWYSEGIANYYAALLPYRWGIMPPERFLAQMNILATAYYTSPARHLTNEESARLAWSNTHAQRLPYYRGAMHLFDMQAQIVRASNGTRSLDDCVLALLKLKNTPGKPFGITQWLELLTTEIGPLAKESFDTMSLGAKMIVPPADTLGPSFTLRRSDQFAFDLGFEDGALGERVVRGLKKGSRADLAGLKDGDKIVRNNRFRFQVADYYENEMEMVIKRDGEDGERTIRWWPRGWDKVEAWEWVLLEKEEAKS